MDNNTPSQIKIPNLQDNKNLKLNSLNTPIEDNKYYDKILISKYNEKHNNQIYKTIALSRKNNNINNKDSIPKPQNLYINNFKHDLDKTKTDPYNENEKKEDYKTQSLPKNRKSEILAKKKKIFYLKVQIIFLKLQK